VQLISGMRRRYPEQMVLCYATTGRNTALLVICILDSIDFVVDC